MREWFSKLLAETTPPGRRAFQISLVIMGLVVSTLPIYFYIYSVSKAWQVLGIISAMVVLGMMMLYTAVIARDNRHQASINLMILSLGIFVLLLVGWVSNLGLALATGLFIFTTMAAGQALTSKEAPRTILISLTLGVTVFLMDLFAWWERLSVPALETLIPYITALVILYQASQIIRQFGSYSIRTKFIVTLVGTSLVSIVMGAFVTNRVYTKQASDLIGQDLNAIAKTTSTGISLLLEKSLDQLNILGLNKFIQDNVEDSNATGTSDLGKLEALDGQWRNSSEFSDLVRGVLDNELAGELGEFQSRYPEIEEAFITDKYGAVIASTVQTSDYYQADEEWWQKAWSDGKGGIYISQPVFDENTKVNAIIMAIPISGHNRSYYVGVLRITLNISKFNSILEGGHFGQTGHADLYFADGQYLNDDPSKGLLSASEESVSIPAEGGGEFSEMNYEGNISLVSRSSIKTNLPGIDQVFQDLGWFVVVHQHSSEAQAPIKTTQRLISLLSLGLLMGVALLSYYLGNQFIRPIENLTNAATRMAHGNLQMVTGINSQDEIGLLANSFNAMTSQLRDVLEGLEQRVTDRTKALVTSTEISRKLSTILDEKQLVAEVVEQIKTTYNYYHGQIYLLGEDGQTLVLAGASGEAGKSLLERKHVISIERGVVGRAARSKASVLVPDTSRDSDWIPNPLLPDTKAEVAAPILSGDELLGVIDMQDDVIGDIYMEDVEFLQSIASQVAVALKNARSYAGAQARAEREALISSISQKIQSETTVESAMQAAIREVGRALGASTRIKLKSNHGER
ncbi:MAG: GAF domain-containing protein [Chloroflexi bacterium]|nr:GAF domain-containing protein [Chloroflexota bacterium]